MGLSGSDKSTQTKLLQDFCQPSAGAITLDGVGIRSTRESKQAAG